MKLSKLMQMKWVFQILYIKPMTAIEKIDNQLSTLTLDDLFPDIQNPLIPMGLGMPFLLRVVLTGTLNLPSVNPQV